MDLDLGRVKMLKKIFGVVLLIVCLIFNPAKADPKAGGSGHVGLLCHDPQYNNELAKLFVVTKPDPEEIQNKMYKFLFEGKCVFFPRFVEYTYVKETEFSGDTYEVWEVKPDGDDKTWFSVVEKTSKGI